MPHTQFSHHSAIDFELVRSGALDQELINKSVLNKIESASDRTALIKIIKAELAKIGVTHFSIRQIFKQGDIELPVATFPNALNSKIAKLALGDHDIAVDYALAGNQRPLLLSEINSYLDKAMFATRGLQKNRQLKELYERFGFQDVLYLPMIMKGQSAILLVSMGIEDMEAGEFQQVMVDNRGAIMGLVKALAELGLAESSSPALSETVGKTKELEDNAFRLLQIMATRNISLKGAAALMGVSSGIANKYIAAAKSILNTSSQTNAIYLAIKLGHIKCEPEKSSG